MPWWPFRRSSSVRTGSRSGERLPQGNHRHPCDLQHPWQVHLDGPLERREITFTVYGGSGGNVVETLPGPTIEFGDSRRGQRRGDGHLRGQAWADLRDRLSEAAATTIKGQTDGPRGLDGGRFGTTAHPGPWGAVVAGELPTYGSGRGQPCASGQSWNEFDRIIVRGGGGGAAQGYYGQGNEGGPAAASPADAQSPIVRGDSRS